MVAALPTRTELLSRRSLLGGSLSLLAASAICPALQAPRSTRQSGLLFDLMRQPDLVQIVAGAEPMLTPLSRSGARWSQAGAELQVNALAARVEIALTAPALPVHRIHLRWRNPLDGGAQVLGDAWERSYADLAWLPLRAERVLPWYFVCASNGSMQGAGVKTGASALAFWQVDSEGVSLWLDVRNGGNGVVLGQRTLALATVVQQRSTAGQTAWQTTIALCKAMAAGTEVVRKRGTYSLDAIYGSNDWYYAYGKNTPEGILRDADLMRELAPAAPYKPFCIIDDGYQNPTRFPSMARLAEEIRKRDVAPGIWIRPTRAAKTDAANLLLPQAHWANRGNVELAYDPTIPEAHSLVMKSVTEACDWGYDFIKHDFTTYELLGGWGSQMGPSPTRAGWSFHDTSRTNAEIIGSLYRDIRTAAGNDRIILGCNTIGHLSVGLFDASRTGDDVSGRDWERTRHMGVNTLAFRLPQNRVFFATDADCVPITPNVSWQHTETWLRAVAASGSVLLVSPDPKAMGVEQKKAVRRAFQTAASSPVFEPLDWMETNVPTRWRAGSREQTYEWLDAAGASPFAS